MASRPCENQVAPWSLSGLTQTLGRREASPNLQVKSDTQWDCGPTAILGTTGTKFLAKQAWVSTRWECAGGWEHHIAVEPEAGPQWILEGQAAQHWKGVGMGMGTGDSALSGGNVLYHLTPGNWPVMGMSQGTPGWRWAFFRCYACEILEVRLERFLRTI